MDRGRRSHRGRCRVAPGLVQGVAGKSVGAVVEEHLAENGVVAAGVDVGTLVRRNERDDGHPTQRDDDHDENGDRDMSEPAYQVGDRGGQDVGEVERREDQPGLQHLGLEREADPDARDDEGVQSARRECQGRGICREHEQQYQQRVRDVAPVEQDRDRRGGQGHGRGEAGTRTSDATHGAVEDQYRQHALHHLGQDDGPGVKAEDPHGERLDPEGAREFVDRDRAPRVEGGEEEVVPALRHAARRGTVEGLDGRVPDTPAVGEGCQRRDDEERRPGPAGLVGWRPPELPAAAAGGGWVCSRHVARLGGTRLEREAPGRIPHRRATYCPPGGIRVPSGCRRGAGPERREAWTL